MRGLLYVTHEQKGLLYVTHEQKEDCMSHMSRKGYCMSHMSRKGTVCHTYAQKGRSSRRRNDNPLVAIRPAYMPHVPHSVRVDSVDWADYKQQRRQNTPAAVPSADNPYRIIYDVWSSDDAHTSTPVYRVVMAM